MFVQSFLFPMSKAEQLWEISLMDMLPCRTHIITIIVCRYNPWVVGIATGKLPTIAWQEYLQQDTFYLR